MCRLGKSPRRKDEGRSKSGVTRLERMTRGSGIKDRDDARRNVNCSDSSGISLARAEAIDDICVFILQLD